MESDSRREELDAEILESVSELIARIFALGESMAQRLGVPSFFIKALHTLEHPMAMKDLGKRLHCDPSFVTVIADMLEKRGLARREAHTGDRRVKNVVLTDEGLALKHRVESEMAARMPWRRALTYDERTQLLALIRKMLTAGDLPDAVRADPPVCPAAAEPEPPAHAGEVDDSLSGARTAAG